MNKWLIIVLFVVALFAAGAVVIYILQRAASTPLTPVEANAKLQELLQDRVESDKSLHNGVLLVDAPALGVDGAWAVGIADARDGSPMTAETPFLSASIGKLFTAATVLSLAEEGAFSLDDSITDWLPPEVYGDIPVVGGDEALDAVTLRLLLAQRSGIPDYFEGKTADGAPSVFDLLVDEPEREWTPQTLLDYVKTHYEAAGAPDESFTYSDTNYDLLGMIVEQATGQHFHQAVEQRVLQPLGLDDTWYHAHTDLSRSGPPQPGTAAYADVWMDDQNLAGAPSLSLDWAGGGLATTVGDLRAFMRSLVASESVPFDAFQQDWTENALSRGIDYGYGLWRIRPPGIVFLLRGYPDLYGVSGSTGTYVYYVPEYDAVIAGAFNQSGYQAKHVRFLLQALAILRRTEH